MNRRQRRLRAAVRWAPSPGWRAERRRLARSARDDLETELAAAQGMTLFTWRVYRLSERMGSTNLRAVAITMHLSDQMTTPLKRIAAALSNLNTQIAAPLRNYPPLKPMHDDRLDALSFCLPLPKDDCTP